MLSVCFFFLMLCVSPFVCQGKQLLKDRNKSRRKRSRVDMCLPSPSPIISKAPGNETPPVKLLSVDAQNGSRVTSPKGTIFKRVAEPISNKSGTTKGDLSTTRTVKQKRKSGGRIFSFPFYDLALLIFCHTICVI